MATNLLEWSPFVTSDPKKVLEVLKITTPLTSAAFNVSMAANQIPGALFNSYFMPYAERHWPYDGPSCNCEDLANALALTYEYIRKLRKEAGIKEKMLETESQAKALASDSGYITKPLRAVGGLARGNVLGMRVRNFDGRCYFPNHTFCKFGTTYYDPTFNLVTLNRDETVLLKVSLKIGQLRICREGNTNLVYARDTAHLPPRFADSWYELEGEGWITAQAWGTLTARGGLHTRSGDLKALDAALKSFEDSGYSAFSRLKAAFENWVTRNPNESKARNKDNCVNGLAKFLGVRGVNYPRV